MAGRSPQSAARARRAGCLATRAALGRRALRLHGPPPCSGQHALRLHRHKAKGGGHARHRADHEAVAQQQAVVVVGDLGGEGGCWRRGDAARSGSRVREEGERGSLCARTRQPKRPPANKALQAETSLALTKASLRPLVVRNRRRLSSTRLTTASQPANLPRVCSTHKGVLEAVGGEEQAVAEQHVQRGHHAKVEQRVAAGDGRGQGRAGQGGQRGGRRRPAAPGTGLRCAARSSATAARRQHRAGGSQRVQW